MLSFKHLLASAVATMTVGVASAQTAPGASEADAVRRLMGHQSTAQGQSLRLPAAPKPATSAVTSARGAYAPAGANNSDVPTIGGSLLFRYDWAQTARPAYGIYAFAAQSPINYQPLALGDNLFALGGGCYHDGRYSVVTYYETMGALIASYCEYDTETWEEVKHYNNVGVGSIAVDMAYDPVSQTLFGCFINDTRDGYVFGTLDTNTGVRTAISNLRGPLFAMGSTSQGQLYGVDSSGNLVKIDKNTGATTLVGNTGLRPYNTQSAAFDLRTDRMYWAACTETKQGLYEVDITNGAATLIANFEHGEEWGGLYVVPPMAADAAPAAVSNLSVNYDPATTASANVSFTMPTQTFGGTSLSGDIDYVVTLNGTEVEMGTAAAGATVSLTVYNNIIGEATIGVRCRNDEGQSPNVRTALYLGHDAPAAVGDLKLTVTDAGNVITWTAPTTSVHGGYCDYDAMTYRVVRQPENRVVANRLTATTFTDKVEALVLSEFSYDVIPFAGTLQGESSRTEKVLVGDAFEVPYEEDFNSDANFGLFTIVDANGDGSSWYHQNDGTAQSYYSMTQAMDDWLITPPIHLTTEQLYRFSMDAKVMNGFPERLEVFAGRDRTPEAMTVSVLPVADYHNASYDVFSGRFGVDEEGDWYIGLHCVTPAEGYRMNIDRISIDADLLTAAPAAATDLSVTPGERGALEATVALTAPATAINGTALSELKQVKVYRANKLVKSFSNPAPGERLTFTEKNLPNGMATYEVEALNASGPGIAAVVEAYVGVDVPALASDVHLEMKADVPTLTWTAPTIGQHGGYIDPATLTYYVQRGTDEVLVAQNVTALTATDAYFTMPDEQEEIYYYVYAATTTGIGMGQPSNVVVVGPPYALPFTETFANGYLDHSLWGIIDAAGTGTWGIVETGIMPLCDASDSDKGLLEFQAAAPLDESFLYSGKIDVSQATAPVLTFDYYYFPQQRDLLEIYVCTDGEEWLPVDYIDYADERGEAEWRTHCVELGDALKVLAKTGTMQVGFRALSIDGIWRLHMDHVVVAADASAISTPILDRQPVDTYYDLAGRRSTSLQGLRIGNNGRKLFIR